MNPDIKDLIEGRVGDVRSGARSVDDIDDLVASAVNSWQTADIACACQDLDTREHRGAVEAGILPPVACNWPAQSVESYVECLRSAFVIEVAKRLIHDELRKGEHGQ